MSASVRRAHDQHHLLGEAGQVERGLAGRVGGPDDVDLVALDWLRLAGVGAVVDAPAGELVEPGRLQPPVGHAGGHDERPGLDLPRAVEEHRPHRPAGLEADDVARQDHLGAEAGDLGDGALGEVGAAQALGEPQVVLDRRALSRLAAGGLALDDDGAQALGGRVHRGGQAGRPAADDAHVVQAAAGRRCAARARPPARASTASGACRRRAPARAGGRPGPPGRGRAAAGPRRRARRRTSGRGRGCGPGTA